MLFDFTLVFWGVLVKKYISDLLPRPLRSSGSTNSLKTAGLLQLSPLLNQGWRPLSSPLKHFQGSESHCDFYSSVSSLLNFFYCSLLSCSLNLFQCLVSWCLILCLICAVETKPARMTVKFNWSPAVKMLHTRYDSSGISEAVICYRTIWLIVWSCEWIVHDLHQINDEWRCCNSRVVTVTLEKSPQLKTI